MSLIQQKKEGAFSLRSSLVDWWDKHIYEKPSQDFRDKLLKQINDPSFVEYGNELLEKGVVMIPGYVKGDWLKGIQEDFERFASEPEYAQYDKNKTMRMLGKESQNYLERSYGLSKLVSDPYLVGLAEYYWGKRVVLTETNGFRDEPIELPYEEQKIWHHDTKRKQIKVMLFLREIPTGGQGTSFIAGTHKIWHPDRKIGVKYTCEEAQAYEKEYGPVVDFSGPAGTVAIFDTNGLHRGNRNLTARRDIWRSNYTAGKYLFPIGKLHPKVVSELSSEMKKKMRVSG